MVSYNLTANEISALLLDLHKQHGLFHEVDVVYFGLVTGTKSMYWWDELEKAIALICTAPEDKVKAGVMRIQLKRGRPLI